MFDPREFRDALGRFATGVTIVTTTDADGRPVGVTANSYNSVSLDPPLVLWSLAKTARSMEAFQNAKAFAIHILGREQQDLASRFASRGEDKFAGLALTTGAGGVPVLPDCAAHFECETTYAYEGGDHVIFVGRVVSFEKRDKAPLLFHQGRFSRMETAFPDNDPLPEGSGRYTHDFLPYLLSRAHVLMSFGARSYCAEIGVSDRHYATLGLLSMVESCTARDMAHRLHHTGQAPDDALLADMADRQWIDRDAGDGWRLTAEGRTIFIAILSRSRAAEEDLLQGFSPEETEIGKAFLRKLIIKASAGLPSLID